MEKWSYYSESNKGWINVYAVIADENVAILHPTSLDTLKEMSRATWDEKLVNMKVKEGWGYKGY